MILLGIIAPILAFFVTINFTFSYFTSQSNATASSKTAKLIIEFSDNTKTYANSDLITADTLLLPGDTIKINGSVENSGNIQTYVILKLEVTIKKPRETTGETDLKFYSFNNSTLQEITDNNGTYSCNAFVLNAETNKAFEVTYTLSTKINDDYQNGTVEYSIQACAIQTVSLPEADQATTLLLQQFGE